MNRRDFLKGLLAGAAAVVGTALVPIKHEPVKPKLKPIYEPYLTGSDLGNDLEQLRQKAAELTGIPEDLFEGRRVMDVVRVFHPQLIVSQLVDVQPIDGNISQCVTLRPRYT